MNVLDVKNLCKAYNSGRNKRSVLKDLNFQMEESEMIAIMGASGCGKSTLLNMIAGLSKADEGDIIVNGENLKTMDSSALAQYRRNTLGIVFQDFNLLDSLNVEENIALPMILEKRPEEEQHKKIFEITKVLGIQEDMRKEIVQLSGGERQRVAIARALVNNPKLLLADEPTGSLDRQSAQDVMQYFTKINQEFHTSLLIVTHDIFTAFFCDKVCILENGIIKKEIKKENTQKEYQAEIMQIITNSFTL